MKNFWNEELDKLKEPISTVIDVGVMEGTPDLYSRWSDSNLILIDPLIESKELVKQLLSDRKYSFFNVALGDKDQETTINIPRKLRESSLLIRTTDGDILEKRTIDMRTLDSLSKEHPSIFKPPFLLKVDTEGFELNVLSGSDQVLRESKYVILEVSVKKRFYNSYSFEDIIFFMFNHGFRVEAILRAPKEITILDILFVNHDIK